MAKMKPGLVRLTLLALAVSSLVLSAVVLRASALTWSTSSQVPVNTTFNTNPSVTEDLLGRLWLVYQSSPILANPKIYYKTFNGFTWTAEQVVTSDPSKNTSPAILTLTNGTLLIAWTSNRTGNAEIFYKTNTGGIWSQDRQLTSSTSPDTDVNLAQDLAGNIWVAWQRATGGTADIYYVTMKGTVKSPEFQLTTDPAPDILPSVVAGLDGKVWVAWASLRTGNYEIWWTTLSGPGAAHVENQLTKDSATDQNPEVIQARDGSTLIVWSREIKISMNQFESDLYYETTADNGVTWSVEQALTSSTLFDDFAPSAVQSSDKKIWLFWSSDMPAGTDFNIFYEFSNQVLTHNVSVVSLSASPNNVPKGTLITINATVADSGDFSETTRLTITANSTVLLANNITLTVGQVLNSLFSWDTTTYQPGCYFVTATLAPVSGELIASQFDNSLTFRVHVLYLGDLNRDGVVNIIDVAILANSYATTPGSPNWNPNADLNHDNVINIIDLAILANNYAKSIHLC